LDHTDQWKEQNPYRLRAEALKRDLNRLELGRILVQLATRRGFKSNRKTDQQDAEAKGLVVRQQKLHSLMGSKTLGEFL